MKYNTVADENANHTDREAHFSHLKEDWQVSSGNSIPKDDHPTTITTTKNLVYES